MKIVLFLIGSLVLHSATPSTEELRSHYFAANNVEAIKSFYTKSLNANEADALQCAYKGVAIAMYAEVVSSVNEKFSYFNRGKILIEKSIALLPNNAEIRFLRFSVQAEIPWLLGYSSDLEEDANLIIETIKKKEINPKSDYWKKAITFMLESEELTSDQVFALKIFSK